MKKLSTLFVLVFLSASVYAQGVFEFAKTAHDFGDVTEGDKAAYTFEFKNTGNAPIVMTQVSASCGCTTPEWTKEPILPGETGMIKAIYNSANRPGAFSKSITVISNASEASKVLKIKGMVIKGGGDAHGHGEHDGHGHASKDLYKDQPEISIERSSFDFGKTQRGQAVTKDFIYKNTGKSDLVIEKIRSKCNCVEFSTSPKIVKPGEEGVLKVVYKPLATGKRPEAVTIYTNNKNGKTSMVIMNGEVVDSLTEKNLLRKEDKSVPFK